MRHDWLSKVIHWEMRKKFKFEHTNKWYMHNPALVLKNEIKYTIHVRIYTGCPVGCGCRIHSSHEYPVYDTKQSDSEVPVMMEL